MMLLLLPSCTWRQLTATWSRRARCAPASPPPPPRRRRRSPSWCVPSSAPCRRGPATPGTCSTGAHSSFTFSLHSSSVPFQPRCSLLRAPPRRLRLLLRRLHLRQGGLHQGLQEGRDTGAANTFGGSLLVSGLQQEGCQGHDGWKEGGEGDDYKYYLSLSLKEYSS